MMAADVLARTIREFLKKYAKKSADNLDDYNSPDAYELENFACLIDNGFEPERMPWSEWGSGGYSPYNSLEGRSEHDRLLKECEEYLDRVKR